MSKVKLLNVSKRFGKVIAVDNVSFTVNDAEFFAIIGPTGCGKTTVLRIIAGLETPDEGEVYIDDKLMNFVHPKDRDVAMVFQNYALYPHMKVFENIAFPLLVRKRELKLSNEEIERRVKEIAKLLQIDELLSRYPSQLSGGQQQRVALARALVRKPKVWLLDEPLSNLDAKLRLQMRAEIKRYQRELNMTTIYVTHDQIEAMSMADRIGVMNAGKMLQIGKAEELYNSPRELFVATFIGSPPMNIIPCEYMVKGDKVILKHSTFEIALEKELSEKIIKESTSKDIFLGIRAENIKIEEEGKNYIKGKILISEMLGAEQLLMIELNGTMIRVKAPVHRRFNIGEIIYLSFDWSKILIFDAKTNKLII